MQAGQPASPLKFMDTIPHLQICKYGNSGTNIVDKEKEKHILPKIVNENNHFKRQQGKEHNLHINSWMISNWAKTKGKERWDRGMEWSRQWHRNIRYNLTKLHSSSDFRTYLLNSQDICREEARTRLASAPRQQNDKEPTTHGRQACIYQIQCVVN